MDQIKIRGAREHNLKNLNLDLPRNALVVLTGVSGSGKSSLAFDTLYAEGQRRYVESLSAYARQFLGQMEKPDVDQIEGLSPAISIEQRTAGSNPRSTVATVTEIYDYLRLLFARVGVQHCVRCGRAIRSQTVQEMVDHLLETRRGQRLQILAPVVRGRKGEYRKELAQWRKLGFVRARIDGRVVELEEEITLDKKRQHTIEILVDRLVADPERRSRLHESLETATRLADGMALVLHDAGEETLSASAVCPVCQISYEPLQPRSFSFNSPYGACKECDGLGTTLEVDPDRVIPDRTKSLREGAVVWWGDPDGTWTKGMLQAFAKRLGISFDTPFAKLPAPAQRAVLYGLGDEKLQYRFKLRSGTVWSHKGRFQGVIPEMTRRYRETQSEAVRSEIESFMSKKPCPACGGARLRPESLAVRVGEDSIADWVGRSAERALASLEKLALPPRESAIAEPIRKELRARLEFLLDVGVGYLTLDRPASTLSGGEAQRIRLATQIGSRLTGVLYILDEPSIGLHPRDNRKLLDTLLKLRDLGNSVLVVEHDRETIEAADHVVDLGPGAGRRGGYLVAQGPVEAIRSSVESLTGRYLSGAREIALPRERRPGSGAWLEIDGARQHNLKGIRARFPLGTFVCVTGVSGSGKSTLVNDILYRALAQRLHGAQEGPGAFDRLIGVDAVDKVIAIDQSPIGRTPRSNPATYTGLFSLIRDLFAQVPEAKVRGYRPGRFSFNVKGGRCEACAGEGLVTIEMHFLPDVYVVCDVCRGKRYNRETLEVTYKGKSIADMLEMTVDEALELLGPIPAIRRKLETLAGVGLGYIHLGQSATTLSGGEAQRVKLATELSRVETGRTLYILDEPTTGLHFEDVRFLLDVLDRLTDRGNTVIVIEHNLDVIKRADWILDLGPEGGEAGGRIVAEGAPEDVAAVEESHTGAALRAILGRRGLLPEAEPPFESGPKCAKVARPFRRRNCPQGKRMLETAAGLKRTPFHPRHVALGAKMVPFAGHEMPIQYEGIVAEHRAVRAGVGVFDVSHMGEIRLHGPGAAAFVNRLVTNEVESVPDGKVVYTPMCLESGGIIDDLLVYALGQDRLLVVNAANFEKDLAWVRQHAPGDVTVLDENDETAQLAVQGPRAEDVVARLYGDRVRALGFYEAFMTGEEEDWTLVSRTGYTGEDGFEIYVRAPRALELWDRVFESGRAEGIRAIGLGARDTLRLEMGYCLYGNDIDEGMNPLEAGLGWTVRFNKPEFIGREALRRDREIGVNRRLVGLVLEESRIARPGCEATFEGQPAGRVTSGSMGISVGRPIAMAYLSRGAWKEGTRVEIETRGQATPARVTGRPIYEGGSVRSPKTRRPE